MLSRVWNLALTLFSAVTSLAVSPVDDKAVLLVVGRLQLDLDPLERAPRLTRLMACSGIQLVHPRQMVAQACADSG